ncbi:hypothetical protein [Streptomyces atratus]|uniref:hypothetical protein n=1 Tax=Streptomyces atratus TaxID=1893 RepID=UPI00225BBE2F|nr:hypothetical protein [Streptomyces atratus]MCX5340332.1 hypothetical protein [Streptomyces atratus]
MIGKPYFSSATPNSEDASSRDPERWAGQLPDGSWAAALFNRTDSTATREIDFADVLGIEGTPKIRDVWEKADLDPATSLSTEVPTHGCQLVRITPNGSVRRCHAAFAAWGGGAGFANDLAGHAGMGYAAIEAKGASVTFAVDAASAGTYPIALRYAAEGTSTLTLGAEKPDRTPVSAPQQVDFPASDGKWETLEESIDLDKGTNLITLLRSESDAGAVMLNHIEIA